MERLKFMRGNKSIRALAKELGLTEATYSRYESGSRKVPDPVKVKIANYFNCTVGWLFFDEGSPPDIDVP